MKKEQPKVTIYNGGFGVVRLIKEINCPKAGINTHKIEDVAARIDTTSVKIKGVSSNIGVLEQNFRFDLVSLEKLMQRCVGQDIKAVYTVGDKERLVEGKLLSYFGSQVLIQAENSEIEVFQASKLKLQSALGKDLILKPTLEWILTSDKKGKQQVELSYITEGISWVADYVAVLSTDEKTIDLQGWVNIMNSSGQKFDEANVKLIAGDVRRETGVRTRGGARYMTMGANADAESAQFQEEQLFDYHMYELKRPATIADKEEKQIGLMKGEGINVTKRYVYNGQKVGIYMGFVNSKKNHLGEPLPAGKMKFFKADSSKQLQFIGESRIGHTPKEEEVKNMYLGNAFDIAVSPKKTHEKRDADIYEVTMEYLVKNRKDEKVSVELPFPMHANRTLNLQGDTSGIELVKDSADMYTVHVALEPNLEKTVTVHTKDRLIS